MSLVLMLIGLLASLFVAGAADVIQGEDGCKTDPSQCEFEVVKFLQLGSAHKEAFSSSNTQADGCGDTFETKLSHQEGQNGASSYCWYPTDTEKKFPLVSFMHGDNEPVHLPGSPSHFPPSLEPFLKAVASSGFVVCAPASCRIAPDPSPACTRSLQYLFQLDAIKTAKNNKGLPIDLEAKVGIIGHSTGGMTTLKCAYKDYVDAYSIGAAVVVNGDGPPEYNLANDNVSFEDIDPSLPMFLITGTKDKEEPQNSTERNAADILKHHPSQPLLVANIDGEDHSDLLPFVFDGLKSKSMEYIIAYFWAVLKKSSDCNDTLLSKLKNASPTYYECYNRCINH